MNKHGPYRTSGGFTIVELIVVIVVIGILAAVAVFAYNGITKRAIDSTVNLDAQQTQIGLRSYATDHNEMFVSWFSGGALPSGLNVPMTSGNTIDISVSANKKSYCVRVYNEKSSYSSLVDAYKVGSDADACQNMGPSLASTNNRWKSVYAGSSTTCALAVNDFVYCWGISSNGTLGTNSSIAEIVSTPTSIYMNGQLAGLTIKQLGYSGDHGCVIASDNKLYCWGGNTSGSLGNNTTTPAIAPTAVVSTGILSGKTMSVVKPGAFSMCASDTDGKMYCWGEDDNKQLGNNSTANSLVPVVASAWGTLDSRTVTSISTGNDHMCVIASGTAYCYGDNDSGQSGTAMSSYTSSAINISSLSAFSGKTITHIEAMGDHTCASTANNQLYCWGFNTNGEVGNGGNTATSTPTAVSLTSAVAGKTIEAISGGYNTSCVLVTDGNVSCWGLGSNGQLGNNASANSGVPVDVSKGAIPNGVTLKSLSAGRYHVCGIGSDEKIYCWGWNVFGQLGTGSTSPSTITTPVQAIPSL